jgi:CubicO group peptidase (beta-lactamase class C family)
MVFRALTFAFSTALLAQGIAAPNASGSPNRRSAPPDGHARMPHVAPESVGMSASRLAEIDEVVRRGISAGGFPGAAVIVGRHGSIVWERGYGTLDWRSSTPVDAERTMYDVASLTKVVATTAAVMVLADRGKLRLDEPVVHYLPAFTSGGRDAVTIRDLLTHRSGLPAGSNLSREGPGAAAARRAVLSTPLVNTPGARSEYSDLGPDVLGFAIERITSEPLDQYVARAVYGPLGMRSTMFRPPQSLRARIAPTSSPGTRGEVHDGNARALGGVAGHAGLFATAGDLSVFAQLMLDGGVARGFGSRLVADSIAQEFIRPGLGWRGLGWETCSGGGSCGQYLSLRAFGHTGFTGTSMWIDPERDLFVIVLTNWVHGRPWGGTAPVAVLHDVRSDVVDLAALAIRGSGQELAAPWRLRSELQIGWGSATDPVRER